MQQRNIIYGVLMRLPFGYDSLKKNLGAVIRAARKDKRLKQAGLAEEVGVRRETLSRIELDRRPPRPQVLAALMRELELDWPDVARPGSGRNPLSFVDGSRGDRLIALGQALQSRRLKENNSLRTLAARLGLSASTLSRLERGQLPRSRVFKDSPEYACVDFESRPVQICHQALAAYLAL